MVRQVSLIEGKVESEMLTAGRNIHDNGQVTRISGDLEIFGCTAERGARCGQRCKGPG